MKVTSCLGARSWCGDCAGGGIEWRFRVPFPQMPMGAFVSTGRDVVVTPFVRGAWLEGTVPGAPWASTGGLRPLAGLGVEWFHQLVRVEVGVDARSGKLGLLADLHHSLWPLL